MLTYNILTQSELQNSFNKHGYMLTALKEADIIALWRFVNMHGHILTALITCADPGSFVRGWSHFDVFFFYFLFSC